MNMGESDQAVRKLREEVETLRAENWRMKEEVSRQQQQHNRNQMSNGGDGLMQISNGSGNIA